MESVAYRAVVRGVKLLNIALMTLTAVVCWLYCYAPAVAANTTVLLIGTIF